jgi:decaprenylphospho-beta-D-erythro-pentofuranosid-2-ulose 2-reductase
MSENVLIIGATSGIARALVRCMAERGCQLLLAGRDMDELQRIRQDLKVCYEIDAGVMLFEATEFDTHKKFFDDCQNHFDGKLHGVVVCHGYLPDQRNAEQDFSECRKSFNVNFLSAVSVMNVAANYMEKRKSGYLAAISSVAGDRGRQSNYIYGAGKAGLTAYLQGLRNRLYPAGVHVLTIKPGFVDTKMTAGLVDPDSPLVATPQRVAMDIDRAIRRRQNVVFSPWFWRLIMAVICSIPEWIFKRLKL